MEWVLASEPMALCSRTPSTVQLTAPSLRVQPGTRDRPAGCRASPSERWCQAPNEACECGPEPWPRRLLSGFPLAHGRSLPGSFADIHVLLAVPPGHPEEAPESLCPLTCSFHHPFTASSNACAGSGPLLSSEKTIHFQITCPPRPGDRVTGWRAPGPRGGEVLVQRTHLDGLSLG